jgi:uncharacterized protein YraI
MHIGRIAALAGFGILALSASAEARTWSGYAIANVNERAGPSTQYPSVAVIPAGAPVVIYGCLNDYTWCDVSWGPNRGWMSAAYLQVTYQSRRVRLHDYISPLGIPFVTFNFDTYWGDYYRHRPFFRQEDRWRRTHTDHNQLPPPPKWPKNNDDHRPGPPNDNNQPGDNHDHNGNFPGKPSGNPMNDNGPGKFHKPPKGPDYHFKPDNKGGPQTDNPRAGMPNGGKPNGMMGNKPNGKPGDHGPDCKGPNPGPDCPKN